MFRCQLCKKLMEPRTSCKKVVVAYRQHMHPMRPKAATKKVLKNGKWKTENVTDPGGPGLQIANECNACPNCALEFEKREKGSVPVQPRHVVVPVKEDFQRRQGSPRPYVNPRWGGERPPRTNNSHRRGRTPQA